VRRLLALVAAGLGLSALAGLIGGAASLAGGLMATAAQVVAVLLLRSRIRAPSTEFMAGWIRGMGVRLLGAVLTLLVLPPLEGGVAYIAVLLPLLFTETIFLK
jgi:hypothetical protein